MKTLIQIFKKDSNIYRMHDGRYYDSTRDYSQTDLRYILYVVGLVMLISVVCIAYVQYAINNINQI